MGKPTIANMIVYFKMQKNDFKFFAKRNRLKCNIVHVKAGNFFSQFCKFKDAIRLIDAEHEDTVKNAIQRIFNYFKFLN